MDTYDLEGQIASRLAAGESMEQAFDGMAKDLQLAFKNTLTVPPANTLGWYVRNHEPHEHVHLELGQNIPETSYDAADYPD